MTHVPDVEAGQTADLNLVRTFDGTRDLLFRLWTDPKYVALWWGVTGASNPLCELDLRPGGVWRIHMRTAQGTVYPSAYEFLEVVENERLVFKDLPDAASPAWSGSPSEPAIHTVTFEALGPRTRVALHTRFASVVDRDRMVKAGMKDGIAQSFVRLEQLLAEIGSTSADAVLGERTR